MYGYEYLKNFLREEGFRVNDKEKSFSFKYNGVSFTVYKDKTKYLVINLLCTVKDASRSKILEVCNDLNRSKFILKFSVDSENLVWCSYEFIPTDKTDSDDFDTIFHFLDQATDEMFEKMKQ